MMGLIERNYMLQFPFHDAEQHFLDWYFKFTRCACDPWPQLACNAHMRCMLTSPPYAAPENSSVRGNCNALLGWPVHTGSVCMLVEQPYGFTLR